MELIRPQALARFSGDGRWPRQSTDIVDWLVQDTAGYRYIDEIFQMLCDRLLASGIPIGRATLHFRIAHPQWFGARITWLKGVGEAEIETFQHGTLDLVGYATSPVARVHDGEEEVRWNLEGEDAASNPSTLLEDLRRRGLTDYVAWPLKHTFDRRHVITFATDAPGGFSDADLAALADLLPALSLVSEIRLKNRMARTLLETYVGPHASDEVLAGAITRGSGKTVSAAIMVCDLRDFTRISELWPRDDVIELLNSYFDAICEPIEANGGEILKFIGDGLLAIFPLDRPTACDDLLRAVAEARRSMDALNVERAGQGRDVLRYGVGIHLGDVMYGNIGSRRRLDFTVIGPAVNAASRLEGLTKILQRPVLVSRAFAERASCQTVLESLGSYPLRGLDEAMEVFAFVDDDCRSAEGPERLAAAG
ncbi:adenylate/guanylate cyclase domain-containing protein [Jiella sonneratiae]|uniref:Adenylate/guanylate cyclase domain-containing protein n=1 Tax=Jiella sonneratiae TaxID=2816856 RepID=A0ABS3J679_9HYPH|nr:adenylate/guanylate cyclase domain-containing protein [Jiella sonneratiae]MBO0905160.1 adenylate/guanylate cyclase domain-containing protein [Jiella sonneratiae]